MSLPRLFLSSVLAAFVCVGCQSTGPGDGDRPSGAEFKTGMPIEPGYAQQLGYNNRWLADLAMGRGQQVHAVRQIGDLIIVVERPDNVVTAMRLNDGSLVWKSIIGNDLEDLYAPVGDADGIYVNSSRRLFTLDLRKGNITNISTLDYPVNAGPYLAEKLAIFGSIAGEVFAHQVNHGYKKWAYQLPATIATPPVQDGPQVFAADTQGNYAMLNAESGSLLWRGHIYGPITAAPVMDRNFVIIASEDQSLYSLQAATGKFRWPAYRSESSFVDPPVVIGRTIYVFEQGKGMTAVESNTGQALWTTRDVRLPLILQGEKLMAFSGESLASLDPATGRITRETPTKPLHGVAVGPDNSLILITRKGELHRIDPNR